MNSKKKIDPRILIPMDLYTGDFPIQIELAYAQPDNTLFGERIYRADTRLWLHRDLADIVLRAAKTIHDTTGKRCILYDGLRTTDAQERMLQTQRVQDNPQWLEEPRLLSPSGAGAHPRGMAIDITIEGLDMGTEFDDLSEAAHRDHPHADHVMQNRTILTDAMMGAADALGHDLLPLPQEWWDFRFPKPIYESFDPLADSDLPEEMRLL